MIFKRSFVVKQDGQLIRRPYSLPTYPSTLFPSSPASEGADDAIVYPLSYAALSAYFGLTQTEYAYRDMSIACTLRPYGARARVLQWCVSIVYFAFPHN